MYRTLLCILLILLALNTFAQRQWLPTPSLDSLPVRDFHPTNDGLLIALYGGAIQKTTNDGQTWRNIPFESGLEGNTFFTQFAQMGNTIYVTARKKHATQLGGVFKSSDEGETWATAYDAEAYIPNAHTITSVGNRLIIGTTLGIYTSDNEGTSWQRAEFDKGEARYYETRCLASNGQTVVGGSGKFVYVSQNGGQTWQPIQVLPGSANIIRLVVVDGRFYAASTGFGFYQSGDGLEWEKLDLGLNETQQNVGVILPIGDDLYYSVADNVYKRSETETTSEVMSEGFPLETFSIRSLTFYKGVLYAGLNQGGVWKYDFPEGQERPLMTAYPNPSAADNIRLTYEVETAGQLSIFLIDANGKRLRTLFEGQADQGQHQLQVDLTAFTDGNYFIYYQSEKGQSNLPLVIAR